MKVLIKNGNIIDPANGRKEKGSVLIENGKIAKIDKKITEEAEHVIDADGLIVSPGFVDLHANFCDPGVTSREDLKTGSLSAAKGGYTHVVLGTDNKPSPSECNVIEYIKKYASIMPVNIYPSAAVTEDRAGEDIADINFLHNHGAIAYYDGLKPIEDKNLLEKIMIAVKKVNGVLSIYCEKSENAKVRGVLDGDVAKKLGIKVATSVDAESSDMEENLALAKMLDVALDLAYVSAPESIELVEKAKGEGQKIYAEVQAINLILSEKALEKYGTNAKVLPPLRPESDRKELVKALKKGAIDIISSNHMPIALEDKKEKMKDAASGAIGLETVLGICGSKLVDDGVLSWKEVIEKLSINPAKVYGLDKAGAGSITEGTFANITIFDPNEKWKLSEDMIASKSHNTPLIDVELMGKVKYTIANGRLVYKDVDVEK